MSHPLPPISFNPHQSLPRTLSLPTSRTALISSPLLFLLSASPPSHSLPPARALLSSSSSLLHPLLSHPCPRVLSSPPLHLHLYRRGFGSSRQTCTRRPHLHRRRQWRGSRNQLRRSRRQLRRGPVLPRKCYSSFIKHQRFPDEAHHIECPLAPQVASEDLKEEQLEEILLATGF